MGIKIAKCDNCGFEQKHIFVSGMGGAWYHLIYSCLKCKKIITSKDKIENCPRCKSKLIKLYEDEIKDENQICPNCGKKRLRLYLEAHT